MVGTSATNTVVFEAECLQTQFVAQHVGEVGHGIIIQVVVVQEDLFQGGVVHKSRGHCIEAQISNQV